eukprot:11220258-Lingulodinium_polyedra.AAC.1
MDDWFGDELRLGLQGVFPTEARFYSLRKFPHQPPKAVRQKDWKHTKKQCTTEGFSVCAAISAKGKTKLMRFGKKINCDKYCHFIRTFLRPAMDVVDHANIPMVTRRRLPTKRKRNKYHHDRDSSRLPQKTDKALIDMEIDGQLLAPKMWLGNPIEKWWGLFVSRLYDNGFKTYKDAKSLWEAAEKVWEETWEEHHKKIPAMLLKVPFYLKKIRQVDGRHLTRKEERAVDKEVRKLAAQVNSALNPP